ncbi:MAG: hypothetical protein KA389_04630 [Hydromonas sp.]|jgi:putative Mn2+ efflux pump MntP|nr:hypothetical protein [Hydromonas sp.]
MSLQSESSVRALLKSFFTFGALQIVVWLIAGVAIWFLSRWIPLWILAFGIIAILGLLLILGNPQNPQKRADMLKDIEPPK